MAEPANIAFSCFRRDRVPSVAELLCLLNLTASKPNRSGYMQMRCPIHGEENPSLSIHLEHGNWKCFACGATGGDALELYRRVRRISFAQAAHELGAWESQ
jgi:CHC2 zinc finger